MKQLQRVLVALLASGCASIRPPPCSASDAWGVVHAPTPAAAERLSQHLSWLAPRIVASVPGLAARPVDARFVNGMHLEGMSAGLAVLVKGATIERDHQRWIELPEGSDVVVERRTLAHELVHYWLGPDWETLPCFLEEGLADNVKDSVIPLGFAHSSREKVLILSSVLFGGLILDADGTALRCGSNFAEMVPGESMKVALFSSDRRTFPGVRETLAIHRDAVKSVRDPEKYAAMFCFGYLLAARIGVERLHTLCVHARTAGLKIVPADWVLEAAGLRIEDKEAWNRAILELHRSGSRTGRNED
jgi:hypothetical protein